MSLVSVIILASGNSQRMGQNKLFLKISRKNIFRAHVNLSESIRRIRTDFSCFA